MLSWQKGAGLLTILQFISGIEVSFPNAPTVDGPGELCPMLQQLWERELKEYAHNLGTTGLTGL